MQTCKKASEEINQIESKQAKLKVNNQNKVNNQKSKQEPASNKDTNKQKASQS